MGSINSYFTTSNKINTHSYSHRTNQISQIANKIQPLALLLIAILATPSFAQNLSRPPSVCTNTLTDAQQRLVDATALMIPSSIVQKNPDGSFKILNAPLLSFPSDQPIDICNTSAFIGIPSARTGRTAVLIGKDKFISAAHKYSFSPVSYKLIFGPKYTSTNCKEFEWDNIPQSNVYDVSPLDWNNFASRQTGYDYVYFKSTTAVSSRKPIKIRRSGIPKKGSPITLVSHPLWSITAVETTGTMTGVFSQENGSPFLNGSYLHQGLHPLPGSSGGGLFNTDDEVADAVIGSQFGSIGDDSNGCLDYIESPVFVPTNRPIVEIQEEIPRDEILVEGIGEITHIGDTASSVTNAMTSYNVVPPTGGSYPYTHGFSVSPIIGMDLNGPSMTTNLQPGSYVLAQHQPSILTINTSATSVGNCGTWNYVVNVRDLYNDQNNYLRHRFEIGLKEISASPQEAWNVRILGSSVRAEKIIRVINKRPTVTVVNARIDDKFPTVGLSHFLIDGYANSTFTLAAAGENGSSKYITISVNENSSFPAPNIIVKSGLSIEVTDKACSISDDIKIPLTLSAGEQDFISYNTLGPIVDQAPPGTLGAPMIFNIDASGTDGWCVSQASADLLFLNELSSSTPSLPDGSTAIDIRLISPSGISSHLWDSNPIPPLLTNGYISDLTILEGGYPFEGRVLRLADGFTPPRGPGTMSTFSGSSISGTWRLEVRKRNAPVFIWPYWVKLKFRGTQC